jgi:hypothetical protein
VFYFGANPGDESTLLHVIENLKCTKPGELFESSATLGLALQACYLVKVEPKTKILRLVIDGLAKSEKLFDALCTGLAVTFPQSTFVLYYLCGRDSVACDLLGEKWQSFMKGWEGTETYLADLRTFWIAVGLIECGQMRTARDLIHGFHPSDRRLLVALYLSCTFMIGMRIATKEEKHVASEILAELRPRIWSEIAALASEVRTHLLEIQKAELRCLDPLPSDE